MQTRMYDASYVPKRETLNVRLSAETLKKFSDKCKIKRVSKSAIVRAAIAAFLKTSNEANKRIKFGVIEHESNQDE